MGMSHEMFQRYWNNAYLASSQNMPHDLLGHSIWVMCSDHCRIEEVDFLDQIKEDFPHLVRLLDMFDAAKCVTIIFKAKTLFDDGVVGVGFDEGWEKYVNWLKNHDVLEDARIADADGEFVYAEYMLMDEGETMDRSQIGSVEHRALMDALEWCARDRGISKLASIEGTVAISPDGKGGFSVEKVIGEKTINKQVAAFSQELDAIFGVGGGDES